MLTSVELFAGAGGLGMGLALAGFRHRAVVEWDQWACDTIRRNQASGHKLVAGWPLHQGDVRDFDFDSISGPIDVVAGGPPCQPFSMGGRHKGHGDQRDMFPAMAEAIRRLRPRAFIIENVKGLTRPAFADYFSYVVTRLEFPDISRRRRRSLGRSCAPVASTPSVRAARGPRLRCFRSSIERRRLRRAATPRAGVHRRFPQ